MLQAGIRGVKKERDNCTNVQRKSDTQMVLNGPVDVGTTVLPGNPKWVLPTGPRARMGPQGCKAWSDIEAVSDSWLARMCNFGRQAVTYMFQVWDMKPLTYRLHDETRGPFSKHLPIFP